MDGTQTREFNFEEEWDFLPAAIKKEMYDDQIEEFILDCIEGQYSIWLENALCGCFEKHGYDEYTA